MKQSKLLKKLYDACQNHDTNKIMALRLEEYKKIFKRKDRNKSFTTNWIVVQI